MACRCCSWRLLLSSAQSRSAIHLKVLAAAYLVFFEFAANQPHRAFHHIWYSIRGPQEADWLVCKEGFCFVLHRQQRHRSRNSSCSNPAANLPAVMASRADNQHCAGSWGQERARLRPGCN